MEELESQIAKIQLGNNKTSSSYVFTMAEKAAGSDAELYVVAEMPLFNPAAEESCERICLAIASTLKRSYKKPANENSFENAIAAINEELGKLASMGQTHWIDKLNCILGVKEGKNFSVASCGKVSAYLLRNKEYTDISCSPAQSHPLKTFENYASGKIRLGDLLILSTTQLFNYLSMDRLLQIVSNSDFLTATKTTIELLKENSDPQITFGVILNLQVPLGQTTEEEADLENYVVEQPQQGPNILEKAITYATTAFGLDKKTVRKPQVGLPKISMGQRMQNFSGTAKNFMSKGKGVLQTASAGWKTSAASVRSTVNPKNFKEMPQQKKFFLASLIILLIAVIFSITVAMHVKNTGKTHAQITTQLKNAQTFLANAQGSLLYKDDAAAAGYLKQAKDAMPQSSAVDSGNKQLFSQVQDQLNQTLALMQKVYEPQVTNLGSIGAGSSLIKLPNYIGTQGNQTIVTYNTQTGKIEDGAIKSSLNILSNVFVTGNSSAVYDGNNLYLWDFTKGTVGAGFSQSLPQKNDFGGMAEYATNKRVYVVDKKASSIISFLAGKDSFSKPIVAATDPKLNSALDVAIDGSIYVLTQNGVSKFQNGRLADFSVSGLALPFSDSGKIYTDKTFVYIYVLDSGNNRILILDKKGNLANTIKSKDFTKLKDFKVDEKGKIMYVLNDGSLLKVSLP